LEDDFKAIFIVYVMLSKGDKSFHQILIYFLFLLWGKYYQDRFLKLHLSCPILSYSFFPLLFYTSYSFLSYYILPIRSCPILCLLFVCSCPTMSFISFFFPIPYFILFPVLFCFSYSFLSYSIISIFSPILS